MTARTFAYRKSDGTIERATNDRSVIDAVFYDDIERGDGFYTLIRLIGDTRRNEGRIRLQDLDGHVYLIGEKHDRPNVRKNP